MARTTKEESRQVQQAIITATVKELARCGYQGLRIPTVARAVGKTQGAVYGRFPDKEALAMEALVHIRDERFLPVILRMQGMGSVPEALTALAEGIAELAEEYPEAQTMLARLAAEMSGDQGPIGREIRRLFGDMVDLIAGLITGHDGDGYLKEHAHSLAMSLVSLQLGRAIMANLFPEAAGFLELTRTFRPVLDRGFFGIPIS